MPLHCDVRFNRCVILSGAIFTAALLSSDRVVSSSRAGVAPGAKKNDTVIVSR
jgi:hypothetical protein